MPAPRRDWASQRAAVRALVFDGGSPSGVDADDPFFQFTDTAEVARTTARLAGDLLSRKRRGAAPLAEVFAGTLAGADVRTLTRRFCRSPWFARYGEVPDRADQPSIEDAFYRFLCDEGVGDPDVRRVEMVDAIIRAFAVQPRPAFRLPPEIERTPAGYVAIVEVAGRRLAFAAVGSRVLRGPADAVLGELARAELDRSSLPPGMA
jgi:hypothetical protein